MSLCFRKVQDAYTSEDDLAQKGGWYEFLAVDNHTHNTSG